MTEEYTRLNRLDPEGSCGRELYERVLSGLKEIVGEGRISADPETLYVYSRCMTGEEAGPLPGVVILPQAAEQVQAVIRLCNKERIPVAIYPVGSNYCGSSLVPEGCVILDLKLMNKIVEVNEKSWYAVVEPGVTLGGLKAHLEKSHKGFVFAYPYSPPSGSVVQESLAGASSNLSLKHGLMSEWICGMDLVIPTGKLVHAGLEAEGSQLTSHPFLSDLAGIFIASAGRAGVCTKMAVRIFPRMPFNEKRILLAYGLPEAYRIMTEAALTQAFDDLALVSGLVMKGAWAGASRSGGLEISEGEPVAYLLVSFSGANADETRLKDGILNRIARRYKKRGVDMIDASDLRTIKPAFADVLDLPSRMAFMLEQGKGGQLRIDLLGPGGNLREATDTALSMIQKHMFNPLWISRPVKGMQTGSLIIMIPVNKSDQADQDKARECISEIMSSMLDMGFMQSRPDERITRHAAMKMLDPEITNLQNKIRDMLDPIGIMSARELQNNMKDDHA
jgi:FAD/FMN-containing dehydrogenase